MDVLSSFKTENQRSLVVLLLPGILALWPFSVMIYEYIHIQLNLSESFLVLTSILYLILSLGTGFLIDDVGSRIELELIEKKVAKRNGITVDKLRKIWDKYLTICDKKDEEPVLLRYYRHVLMRFKFELNISLSLIIMLLGQFLLRFCNGLPFDMKSTIVYTIGILIIIIYLKFEAFLGAVLLHDLRIKLLSHFKIPV